MCFRSLFLGVAASVQHRAARRDPLGAGHPDGRVNCGSSCDIVADGPAPTSNGIFCRGVCIKPDGNLSMLDVNPFGYWAVLGSDEHRRHIGDARRCDE